MSAWVYSIALAIVGAVTLLVALDKLAITESMAITLFSSAGSFFAGLLLPQPRAMRGDK